MEEKFLRNIALTSFAIGAVSYGLGMILEKKHTQQKFMKVVSNNLQYFEDREELKEKKYIDLQSGESTIEKIKKEKHESEPIHVNQEKTKYIILR